MPISRRRLRREYRAMQRHLSLLRGLILLTDLRFREHEAVKKELGIATIEGKESISAFRNLLQTKYMPGDTKARMLFDEFQEIDLYVSGPLELYMCLAQAMVERYRHLSTEDPSLCHPDLDNYLIDNAPAFDAVVNLRDWVLHPGYSRQSNKAATILSGENGEPVGDHPYTIVFRLLKLFGEVTENINELARRA